MLDVHKKCLFSFITKTLIPHLRFLNAINNHDFFHLQNSCASSPCKHGATCISLDQEASYKCACVQGNLTTTIHGSHCETVKGMRYSSVFQIILKYACIEA